MEERVPSQIIPFHDGSVHPKQRTDDDIPNDNRWSNKTTFKVATNLIVQAF
jgi:hypothetical protein